MTQDLSRLLKRVPLAIIVLLLAGAAWLPTLDNIAKEQLNAGLARSLTSFATARALNAAISVAQGTEAAFQPAGVGLVLTPGQALDPINDLVESFSQLMLLASIAFGAERILLEIGGTWSIAALTGLMAVLWLGYHLRARPVPSLITRALVILLVIRFAIPVMVVGSDLLFEHFMANRYDSSQYYLDRSSADLTRDEMAPATATDQEPSVEEKRWFEGLREGTFSFPTISMPESPVAKVKALLSEGINHIIDLMVIFVLQVLVLPVVILWILYTTLRRLIET